MRQTLPNLRVLLLLSSLALNGVFFTSCDEDDPQTLPEVVTAAVTEVTPTSARVGGEIIADGNAEISVCGLVYSSIIAEPTLADDKIELEVSNSYAFLLESLSSGTTYYIRAYATNSVGTGYGEVVEFTTGNAAPTVASITILGETEIGQELTATYVYSDGENDPEGVSVYQWYKSNDGLGTGEVAIEGATGLTYIIAAGLEGKYIRFGVTPKATAGEMEGAEIKSVFTTDIGPQEKEVTFEYNGKQVTYGVIVSTVTRRKWLDRNLGAPNAASAIDDWVNYGDMFQWGRLADGHQLVTWTGPYSITTPPIGSPELGTPDSPQLSSTDVPGHSLFIPNNSLTTAGGTYDWRNPQNDNLWQGVEGINNPCPRGWRIPTIQEWQAEKLTSMSVAYNQLKLTASGERETYGVFVFQGKGSVYWSSTIAISTSSMKGSRAMIWGPASVTTGLLGHSFAIPCRCIKD